MKKIQLILLISFTLLFGMSFRASEQTGKVVWEGESCDFVIIETGNFYVLAEVYSGSLYEGDKVLGELHSYNFKNIQNLSRSNSKVRIFIENYWSSKDTCFEWLRDDGRCSD